MPCNDCSRSETCPPCEEDVAPSLEARAEEAANKARCNRCDVVILQEESKTGVVFGDMVVPILGIRHHFRLCGKCGLGLREYLWPKIVDDPMYQAIKQELLMEHWS